MIEQVSEIVHGLLDSPQVRADVCQAALTSSQATIALLYEPGDLGGLQCTAIAGLDIDPTEVSIKKPSAIYSAFGSGHSVLITEDVEAWVGSLQLWNAAGRPGSILCQPLVKNGMVLGVLAVGWPGSVRAEGPRATVAALLAHEAAGAIARADAMHHLADEAQTDTLTGLPNRRAWDAHLKRATTDQQAYAIAILDLDHPSGHHSRDVSGRVRLIGPKKSQLDQKVLPSRDTGQLGSTAFGRPPARCRSRRNRVASIIPPAEIDERQSKLSCPLCR